MKPPAFLLLLVTSGGCAGEPGATAVGVQQQALGLEWKQGPAALGLTHEGMFGSLLTACGTAVFASGAKTFGIWSSAGAGGWLPLQVPEGVGFTALACVPNGEHLLLGTEVNSLRLGASGPGGLDGHRVGGFAVPGRPGLPLAVGLPGNGKVALISDVLSPDPAWLWNPNGSEGAGVAFGTSVAWLPGTDVLAVGSPAEDRVYRFRVLPDAGTEQLLPVEGLQFADAGAGFGLTLVAGNVLPSAQPELVIGAPLHGRLFVVGASDSVRELKAPFAHPSGPSFAAALAVERDGVAPGLDALWVGDPQGDHVYRFIGEAAEAFFVAPSTTGTPRQFGTAIAVTADRRVAVGAPGWETPTGSVGAVLMRAPLPSPQGKPTPAGCVPGAPCRLPGCLQGTCLGGVFCAVPEEGAPSTCGADQQCLMEECSPLPDGGAPFPGDPPAVSAAPVTFTSSGCSVTPAAPLALLLLAALTQRRRS